MRTISWIFVNIYIIVYTFYLHIFNENGYKLRKINPFKHREECDHDMNRAKICIFCFESKKNVVKILDGGKISTRIKEIVKINLKDERYPTGICANCRKTVFLIEKGEKSENDLPKIFDYTKIQLRTETRRYF